VVHSGETEKPSCF